jgi:hypothetical protein
MPSRNSIAVATTAFLAFAVGFGWDSFQSAHKAETSLYTLSAQRARLAFDIHQTRQRIAARQRVAVALQARIKSVEPKVPPAKSSQRKDENTLIASDPKLRGLYLKSYRALLGLRNAWLYQSLGLTQAQINKYEEMATAQEDDIVAMKAAAIARGLTLSDPGLAGLEKQSKGQFYSAIASGVSEALSQSLINLDRISPVQDTVVFNASLLAPLGSPHLTDLQEAQLGQILANASASYQSGGDADTTTIDWNQAYDQAAAILSGPQLEGFKTSIEFRQYRDKENQFESQQREVTP